MLKNVLASGAALFALTAVASAADLPYRVAPSYYAPPPSFTWTGAYFGLNAGYAFNHDGRFKTFPYVPVLATRNETTSADGFTGGGQVGYNYQFGPGQGLVVGLEADIAYTDLDSSRSVPYGFDGQVLQGSITSYRSSLDYLGTVRGRVGYGFNQFLIYGTGGFAYGGVDNRIGVALLPGGPLVAGGSTSETATGYAFGGGVEYAVPTTSFLNLFHSSAVTVKAEYLHYDLGHSDIAIAAPGLNVASARVTNQGDLVRFGVNYKFGAY